MTKHESDQANADQHRRDVRDRIARHQVMLFRQYVADDPTTDPQAAMRRAYKNAAVIDIEEYDNA